jgi:SWI/SNF-related matrix-associated actin-dependent regulator of chromatin subfamily A3
MRPAGYQSQPSGSNATYAPVTPPRPSNTAGPSASQSATSMSASQRKAYEDNMESLRKAAELRTMLSSLEKVDDEGRRTSLLDSVCTTDVSTS